MGFCYNRLTIHANAGFALDIVDAWNKGDVCVALSERYASDMHLRRDRPEREQMAARHSHLGFETPVGRKTFDPYLSASVDGTSVVMKFSTACTPSRIRDMLVYLIGNKIEGFRLVSTDPTDKAVFVASDWQTNRWMVVGNAEWIRGRIPAAIAEECDLASWVEEEGG